MTRTVTISVSSVLLILVLAFGGRAFAQGGEPGQGPLNAILKAVGVIQKQTASIADSLADAITGLRVVHSELKTVAGSVAAGQQTESQILKGESQILQEVQGLHLKLDKLQASQRPATSAHRLWVSPYWTNSEYRGDAIFVTNPHVAVLNPGDIGAEFECVFLDSNGYVVSGEGIRDLSRPGQRSVCEGLRLPDGYLRSGWLIVTSDRPVLPYGWYVDDELASTPGRNTVQAIQFYPIDCTNPYDDTVSFACRYAKPAR